MHQQEKSKPEYPVEVGLLTGGGDKPYALGIASALSGQGIRLDFVGSDDVNAPELHQMPSLTFLNLRGNQRQDVGALQKIGRVLVYYFRLLRYTATAKPRILHILWNERLEYFDRTLLMLFYKMVGKKIAYTAHNVNAGKRDANDSFLNRLTLRVQYRLADHIFVHTEQMKRELQLEFRVPENRVSVIPFGINSTVPNTNLSQAEARQTLGLPASAKALLFFGHIAPYKGLEYLIAALRVLCEKDDSYRLIIAGSPKGSEPYWRGIQEDLAQGNVREHIIERIEFVPDAQTELYFKAADVLVLPYTHVFQSGVLSLGYNFGLPVIAADVGALREDILDGQTGYIFRPKDPKDLVNSVEMYFASDLYKNLEHRRPQIQSYARERYSWDKVGEVTKKVYELLLERMRCSA